MMMQETLPDWTLLTSARLKQGGRISSTPKDKADTLNAQFQSVFSARQDVPSNILGASTHPTASDITITTHGIYCMLKKLKEHKAAGPDKITARVLKELAQPIAPILRLIFQTSYDTGIVPQEWREANVVPIYKKGQKSDQAIMCSINLHAMQVKEIGL